MRGERGEESREQRSSSAARGEKEGRGGEATSGRRVKETRFKARNRKGRARGAEKEQDQEKEYSVPRPPLSALYAAGSSPAAAGKSVRGGRRGGEEERRRFSLPPAELGSPSCAETSSRSSSWTGPQESPVPEKTVREGREKMRRRAREQEEGRRRALEEH